MAEKMHRVSIFWKNSSSELLEMLESLDNPGETVGNEGCELIVTEVEMEAIRDYCTKHLREIDLVEYGEISQWEALAAIESWGALQ